ncbi:MAG: DUF1311 domain-containing protein [Hyphomicrobiales bacterium]|nr:DUF1311 domain-containing protein [Hyphomicrobiales bacterium]
MFCLIVFLIVPFAFAAPASAEADGPDFWQTVPQQAVPLRAEPDEAGVVIDNLPPGTRGLKNLGCRGGPSFQQWSRMTPKAQAEARRQMWCRTTFAQKTGWVKALDLREQIGVSPGFDCGKANGAVEQLICNDAELAGLDLELNAVYRDALKAARSLDALPEQAVTALRTYQRGWIKGRNDCWKAADVSRCVLDEYQQRMSELQAKWMLVPERSSNLLSCADNSEIAVTFYQTSHVPAVAVEFGDRREIYTAVPAASGTKYQGAFGRYLWMKGCEVLFVADQRQEAVRCVPTPSASGC